MNWRLFCGDERGNIAMLFAFAFTLSALVSALAVDAASLYHERRRLQAGVDLAAISAASDPARAAEIARSVLSEARLLPPDGTEGLVVRVGHYDPARPMAERFRPGALPHNAVEVALERTGRLHFAASFAADPRLGARGLAAVTPRVSFSAGSRLASLNGGLVNALLSALLGSSVSLSVLDYQALAAAQVDLFSFLDILALEMGLSAGSYDDLLAMQAGTGTIAKALATLTNGTARLALNTLAASGQGHMVSIGKLASLGTMGRHGIGAGGSGGLGIDLSALDLLAGAAVIADGKSQISLPLSASLPGLARLDLSLRIGEPAQGGSFFAIGPAGTVLRTAQLRLRIRAELLGGPILGNGGVKLPLWLDIAHAEAILADARCPSAAAPHGSARIAVRPGILRLVLGEMGDPALADFGIAPPLAPVRMVDVLLLLRVNGQGRIEIAQENPLMVDFSSADIAQGRVKTARSRTIPSSLFSSLFQTLRIEPVILGLGLGIGSESAVIQALRNLLAPLGPTLDLTVNAVLAPLGIGLGEADIRVHQVRCDRPVLVG